MTAYPQTGVGSPLSLPALAREVAELEKLAALMRRKTELTEELVGYGVTWSTLQVRAREIIFLVAAKHGLEPSHLTGQSRNADISEARQEAMWTLRQQLKADGAQRFSLSQIGDALGGRDHTTVHHGIARHADRMTGLGLSGGGPWPSALGAEGLARSTGIDPKSSIDSRFIPSQPSGETGPNSPSSPEAHCDVGRRG